MSVRFDFSGRTIVVTGAAAGIGRALTTFFTRAGGRVVAVDLDEQALAALTGAATPGTTGGTGAGGPVEVLPVAGDVADPATAARAVRTAVDGTGRLDVVVNNAGLTRDAMLWKLTDEDWDRVLRVHLGGTFAFTRAAVPVMRAAGYGRIVNVTSYSGLHGNLGQANYSAAKAGIVGFTRTAAKELARFGITVNAVSPNAATAMVDAVPEPRRAELEALAPMGRFGDPMEMAAAVGFLACQEAGYITGVVLPVDGGLSI